MRDLLRDELIATSEIVVVKVGTNVLSLPNGLLNIERINRLTEEIYHIRNRHRKVILVSSGAVGAGMGRLKLKHRPHLVPQLQAVAAIGQSQLVEAYEEAFSRFEVHAAQVLLTADDLSLRNRYLNVRNAIRAMIDYGAIPIVNENDTTSVQELHSTFGDNDRLASLVANLFPVPLLILLTDVDGLFDRDPSEPDANLISIVEQWTPELMSMVVEKNSHRSRGGMSSKIKAAKTVTQAGGNMIIANGDDPEILTRIFSGEAVGTVFVASNHILPARKRWIGYAGVPVGTIRIDDGAVKAITQQGKSLLPIGIVGCEGLFEKGDIVSLVDPAGTEIARGLTNYSHHDLARIQGRKSNEIAGILGICSYEEAIHRDNIQEV